MVESHGIYVTLIDFGLLQIKKILSGLSSYKIKIIQTNKDKGGNSFWLNLSIAKINPNRDKEDHFLLLGKSSKTFSTINEWMQKE